VQDQSDKQRLCLRAHLQAHLSKLDPCKTGYAKKRTQCAGRCQTENCKLYLTKRFQTERTASSSVEIGSMQNKICEKADPMRGPLPNRELQALFDKKISNRENCKLICRNWIHAKQDMRKSGPNARAAAKQRTASSIRQKDFKQRELQAQLSKLDPCKTRYAKKRTQCAGRCQTENCKLYLTKRFQTERTASSSVEIGSMQNRICEKSGPNARAAAKQRTASSI